MESRRPPSLQRTDGEAGPSVRRKQPKNRKSRRPRPITEIDNGFRWWYPGKCPKALMEFVKKNPEHYGKLECEMRSLATTEIQNDHVLVTTDTQQVSDLWRNDCKEKLSKFFKDYAVRTQHVKKFHPSILEDSKTYAMKIQRPGGSPEIAVAGLTKDVTQRIHYLKKEDAQEPPKEVFSQEIRTEYLCIEILPIHCNRLSPDIIQHIASTCQVLFFWNSPTQLQISGSAMALPNARKMVLDEILHTKVETWPCPPWVFERISRQRAEAVRCFPELRILNEKDEISIMGYPIEVDLVHGKISAEIAEYEELKINVPKKYHRCIIGKNGQKIAELRNNHKVSIIVPLGDSADNEVLVRGEKVQVFRAKAEIENLVAAVAKNEESLTACIQITESIRHRITEDIIRKVRRDTGANIKWKNRNEILVTGHKDKVKQAQDAFAQETKASETKFIEVPSWLLVYLSPSEEDRQKWPKVKVDFAENGIRLTGHPTETGPFFGQLSKKLQELQEKTVSENLQVQREFHKNIIGKKGQNIRELKRKYRVEIVIPDDNSFDKEIIIIRGDKEMVEAAKTDITSLISDLENSAKKTVNVKPSIRKYASKCVSDLRSQFPEIKIEESRNQLNLIGNKERINEASKVLQEKLRYLEDSIKTIAIPMSDSQLLGIVGYKHGGLKKLREQLSEVEIYFDITPATIIIEGYKEKAEKAHIQIVKMLPDVIDFCISEVPLQSECIGLFIGRQGNNLKSLQRRYPGVTRIETPRNDRRDDNVIIMGNRRDVDDLCVHMRHRYNAERVKCQTRVEKRGSYGSLSQVRRQKNLGSCSSIHSATSSNYDCDDNGSMSGFGAEGETQSGVKAVMYTHSVPYQLRDFLMRFPRHLNDLRALVGKDVSLIVAKGKICVAGQASCIEEEFWDQHHELLFNEYFEGFGFFDTTFHHLSSVKRSNYSDDDLMIIWNEDDYEASVFVCGILSKVEAKREEFEQIKQRKRAVLYSWQCNNEYFIKFMRGSLSERHKLETTLEDLGQLVVNDKDITITGEILESTPEPDWTNACKIHLDNYFSQFANKEIVVPLLLSGEMRSHCDCQPQFVICWVNENDSNSLAVYGVRHEVNAKVDFLTKKLEEMKNRKKKVSLRWYSGDENQDVFLFVKESTKQMEEFIKFLREIGSPILADGFVTVNCELFETESRPQWEEACRSKIIDFFSQFDMRDIVVSESQKKRAEAEVETHPFVVTKWIPERNILQICGLKAAVNLKVDSIKKKLERSENQENSEPSADLGNAEEDFFPEDFNELGESVIRLKLTETKMKCILASKTAKELCNVKIEGESDTVKISGEKNYVWKAKNFIESIVTEEFEVRKYGAYEFLTDSNLGHIDIKHDCSIVVEQIIDSEWGDRNFICLPPESDKVCLFGKLSVNVKEGDITSENVDMIVNTSNKSFSFDGPLSRAIFSKAGEYLKQEFHWNKIDSEMGITSGGSLKCKKIIHVAIPASNEPIEKLVLKILNMANQHGMTSITLPTIGAGGGGWSSRDVAIGMRKGIASFAGSNPNPTSLQQVNIMLFPSVPHSDKKPFYDELKNEIKDLKKKKEASSENKSGFLYKIFSLFTRQTEVAPNAENSDKKTTQQSSKKDENGNPGDHVKIQKTEHGEFAKIIISSNTDKSVKDAKKEIEKFVNHNLKEFSFNNTAILRLKQSHIDTMRKIAEEQKVRIIVNREKPIHTITIQGGDDYASTARGGIQDILSSISTDLPESWCEMPDGKKLLRVTLTPDSEEYQKVERRLTNANKSWQRYNVVKIERIQNPTLYRQYQSKKKEVAARRSTSAKIDRKLFHGTDSDTLDKICNDVFNRSYAGKNATLYGKGVYFSTQSSYSNSYTSTNSDGTQQMFLARVLTGDYCKGDTSMLDPPKNSKTGEVFDSVVDDVSNPTIFVVFRDWSVYPSYVITYKK